MRPAITRLPFLSTHLIAVLLWLGTTAMHIPDGYLSPLTSAVMFALVLPFWAAGMRSIRGTMNSRNVPLVALVSAFSFVIMMFNIPLPGGTSGHAVGAALAGIILGPEAASIAISIALIIQALFFGDGGVLALGANCFNIGVVIPYVAVAVYRLIGGSVSLTSPRRLLGAGLGAWLGLTLASLLAGVEFGLQPLLFRTADGVPLYAPYPLAVAVPAMVLPHAFIVSVIEGVLTVLVVAYLQKANLEVLEVAQGKAAVEETRPTRKLRWLWIALTVLVVAAPLGLLAPGTAWGEWSTQELSQRGLGTIPAGLGQLSGLWGAPLAGYHVPLLGDATLGYLLSAGLGVLIVAILAWLLTALIAGAAPPHRRGG